MTDIKTALSQAMSDWETPETEDKSTGKHLFKTTNNVTRATFNAVKCNPGWTRKIILAHLEGAGYKPASTTSILSQMIKQRLVREEAGGRLYANFSEYMPLKGTSKPKVKVKVKAAPTPQAGKEKKYTPVEAAPQPQARQERRVMDIDDWLNEVTLMQARHVYLKLKVIFEGEGK
jgi:hypothetical protein